MGYRHVTQQDADRVMDLTRKGWTQDKISDKTGIHKSTIAKIQHGKWREAEADPMIGLTLDQRQSRTRRLAYTARRNGNRPYRDQRDQRSPFLRECSDNLILSIRYGWKGILAEEAGLCPVSDDFPSTSVYDD